MTTFYLIRHGDTAAVGRYVAGRAPGVSLTESGRRQVAELAERLAREPVRHLVCSPLDRTRETAEPVARRLGLAVQVADELTELDFGAWTGQTFDQVAPDEHWRRFNAFRSGTPAPGGELMLEAQARVVPWMRRVSQEAPDQTIVAVSHGDVIRAALLYYLGMPLDFYGRIEISPASVSVVAVGPYGPVVLGLNRTGA